MAFAGAPANAEEKVEAEVYVSRRARAATEQPSVTAGLADGEAEIWTGVQSRGPRTISRRKFLALRPKSSPSN